MNKDVLVIGGGSAGVAAAIAAASAGLKVALIEGHGYLGGLATSAEVGTVCGLYSFSKKRTELAVKGFALQFANQLKVRSKLAPISYASGLHFLPYKPDDFAELCRQWLEDNEVEVMLNTRAVSVTMESGRISGLYYQTEGQECRFTTLGSIIDCTGNATISKLAGLPLLESDEYQSAAQVFQIGPINEIAEQNFCFSLMKTLKMAVEAGELAPSFERVYVVPGSLDKKSIRLKLGLTLPVTGSEENAAALRNQALQHIDILLNYLVKRVPGFENARLLSLAPEVGIRVSARPVGLYVLTENDVLSARKFDSSIANGYWPIEEWGQDKRVRMRYFALDDYYQIPANCLIAKHASNLFFGGRNISASDAAIGSARVMGICLQTGYAAGLLAAANVQQLPESEAILNIQSFPF